MAKVYRKQLIEGVTVPSIIHNMNYFWHNMAVYEDGTISVWDKIDLDDVPKKIASTWLSFSVPDGKPLSVHGLCSLEILSAKWNFTAESYYNYIVETVKGINPEMANIYRTTQREKEKWEKCHVAFTADPTPCKCNEGFGYDLLDGDETNIMLRNDGNLLLTELYAYEDGFFSIDGLEGYFSIDDIKKMFAERTICTAPEKDEMVTLGALGKISANVDYIVEPKAKLEEIINNSLRIQDKPDAHTLCINAYHRYLVEPTEYNKDKLREAYEAVPEHERIFLGDMDSKDHDFQRILYSDKKREV